MTSNAIVNSMQSFIWAIGIGVFWAYIFSVGFMLGVQRHLQVYDKLDDMKEEFLSATGSVKRDDELVKAIFDTIPHTFENLFFAVTGGVDWGELLYPTVLRMSADYWYFFLFFIVFVKFALTNIISGMFIDRAFKAVVNDRDFGILEEAREDREYSGRIKGLFYELDVDQSETLTWDEIEQHLGNPHVKAYFAWLGISLHRAKTVFELIDYNGDEEITVNEFLAGCHMLRGQATNTEAKVVQRELETENRWLTLLVQKFNQKKGPKKSATRASTSLAPRMKSGSSQKRGGSVSRSASRAGSKRAGRR